MATELDKRIIRKMSASLQLYLMHNYPIEYKHEAMGRMTSRCLLLHHLIQASCC